MIQSTKAFSQHLNGASGSTATAPAEVLQEEDNDVEMNGSSHNGSHAVAHEEFVEHDKDDSVDMGTFCKVTSSFKMNHRFFKMLTSLGLRAVEDKCVAVIKRRLNVPWLSDESSIYSAFHSGDSTGRMKRIRRCLGYRVTIISAETFTNSLFTGRI